MTTLEIAAFWHKKTDEECELLATDENGHLNAEQALLNMLYRDFYTEVNEKILEGLKELSNNQL